MAENITNKMMVKRLLDREDNVYKKDVLKDVTLMYADEIIKLLKKGERVQIPGLGTIYCKPKVRVCNLPTWGDNEDKYLPNVPLKIRINAHLKRELDAKFRANIKKGIAGIGPKAMCTPYQKTLLLNSGLMEEAIDDEYLDEEDFEFVYEEEDYGEEDN